MIELLQLTALAVLPFLPAIAGPFLWDDYWLHHPRRVEWYRTWRPKRGGWRGPRSLTHLAHVFLYRLFKLKTYGWHGLNLALHAANTSLVWGLAAELGPSPEFALRVAVVFALHPLHSQAVCYISNLATLLSAVFNLAGFACAIAGNLPAAIAAHYLGWKSKQDTLIWIALGYAMLHIF